MTTTSRVGQTQVNGRKTSKYHLRLFVAGDEPNSALAREALDKICSQYLEEEGCQIEVIDVLEDFRPALEERILITPALVVCRPEPRTVIFGNLTNTDKVLAALRVGK